MTVLLLHPGASWSTADVEAGLRYGLEQHGVKVIRYRLDQRLMHSRRFLLSAWNRSKKRHPELQKPTTGDIFFDAAMGALVMGLWHQVDVVLIVSAMFLHPHVAMMLRRAGLQTVTLFTESPYDLDKELTFAQLVDGCWTNERTAVDAFRTVNARSGYLPHAWHPLNHRPGPQPGDEDVPAHDVVFVGSAFEERIAWLSAIDWTGIDLGLYGHWGALPSRHFLRQYVKSGTVENTSAAALYRRAKVGLNLYRTSKGFGKDAPHIEHAESLNPRAYELAACGAFHVSTYRAEVAEVFGHLVPTFKTPQEASTVIRTWLADPVGLARVSAELPDCVASSSWVDRAAQVIGDIQSLLQQRAA